MAGKVMEKVIEIPEGVEVTIEESIVKCKGPKGEIERNFKHPRYSFTLKDGSIVIGIVGKNPTMRDKMFLGTLESHIKNLIKGVTEGFVYKLKICSGHFPMNVSINNNQLVVKNFIGEKVPRVLDLKEGAKVNIDGDIITIESTNKEIAGTIASDIEKLTRRPGFDTRIFQDGIYIIEKAGKKV